MTKKKSYCVNSRNWERYQTHSQPVEQIVLPQIYRSDVLTMTHDKAGHMSMVKTKNCILSQFYKPNVFMRCSVIL